MSASILREAATAIRADWGQEWQSELPERPFFIAIATWLEACAAVVEVKADAVKAHALAAAIAYLRTEESA